MKKSVLRILVICMLLTLAVTLLFACEETPKDTTAAPKPAVTTAPPVDVAYQVKFVDYNGTVLATVNTSTQSTVTAPVPTRAGYTFSGWSGDYQGLTADTVVYALYQPASSAPSIYVSDVMTTPGSTTVTVLLSIYNNPGISSLKLSVAHDAALVLTNIQFNSAFGNTVTTPEPYTNPIVINYLDAFNVVSTNGVFATLTFDASAVTSPSALTVSATFDPANTFAVVGSAEQPVTFEMKSGTILFR